MSEVIDAHEAACAYVLAPFKVSVAKAAWPLGNAGGFRRRKTLIEFDASGAVQLIAQEHRAQAGHRAGEVVSSTVVGKIIWERQGVKKLVRVPKVQRGPRG